MALPVTLNVPVSFAMGAGMVSGEGGVWAAAASSWATMPATLPTVVKATAPGPPAPAAFRKWRRENFISGSLGAFLEVNDRKVGASVNPVTHTVNAVSPTHQLRKRQLPTPNDWELAVGDWEFRQVTASASSPPHRARRAAARPAPSAARRVSRAACRWRPRAPAPGLRR